MPGAHAAEPSGPRAAVFPGRLRYGVEIEGKIISQAVRAWSTCPSQNLCYRFWAHAYGLRSKLEIEQQLSVLLVVEMSQL